jgi:AraC family transcriptional regulator
MTGILGAARGRFGRITLLDIERPLASHAHPHVHLLFKLGGADRGLQVGNMVAALDDTHCVLVNPWQKHADVDALCTGPTQVLALYLGADWFRVALGFGPETAFTTSTCPIDAATQQRLIRLGQTLDAAQPALEADLSSVLGTVLRHAPIAADRRPSDYRIRRAVRSLRDDMQTHPDFSALARQVGLSRSRFFDQFKSATGVAPLTYRDGLLVERAITLLTASDTPLDAISRQLGFSAPSSFSRFFKERVGFPPRALRSAAG